MTRMLRHRMDDIVITSIKIIGALVVVAFFIAVVVYQVRQQQEWEDWCYDQGGRVKDVTKYNSGWSTSGEYVTTGDTTYFCITNDGRLLDVR